MINTMFLDLFMMPLNSEVRKAFETLLMELVSRKENFRSLFSQLGPIMNHESEFSVAFFMGYLAHSYRELFSALTNRDMRYDEIDETLDYLIDKEPYIRKELAFTNQRYEEEQADKKWMTEHKSSIRSNEIIEKAHDLESSIQVIRNELHVIKHATAREVTRYEVNLAKSGKFRESILR